MNKGKQLVNNTFIILIGKICTQFISFLLLPLYTKVLVTSEYGYIDLLITYIGLLVPLITLQLENSLFRHLIDKRNNEEDKKKIISNVSFLIFILIFIVILIFYIANYYLNIKYGVILLACIISTIFSNQLLQASRGLGDNVVYSIGSAICGITNVLLNLLFLLVLDMNILGVLIAICLSNLVCAIYLFRKEKIYKYIRIRFINKDEINSLLSYSLPLVPNGVIWWIINVSDRTIVTMFLGAASNGIYAAANKFSSLFINLYNVFNMSWTESASLHIYSDDKDEFFSKTFETIINLFCSICLMILVFMPFIFRYIIGDKYIEAYKYIPLLMIGSIFNIIVSFIGSIYIAKKMTKEVAMTSFFSGIINLVINIIFIKHIGIYAAIISTIIAFVAMSIYRIIDVQKYIKLKINYKNVLSLIIIFTICYIFYIYNSIYTNILNIIIVILYSLFINKDMINNVNKFIENKYRKSKTY